MGPRKGAVRGRLEIKLRWRPCKSAPSPLTGQAGGNN